MLIRCWRSRARKGDGRCGPKPKSPHRLSLPGRACSSSWLDLDPLRSQARPAPRRATIADAYMPSKSASSEQGPLLASLRRQRHPTRGRPSAPSARLTCSARSLSGALFSSACHSLHLLRPARQGRVSVDMLEAKRMALCWRFESVAPRSRQTTASRADERQATADAAARSRSRLGNVLVVVVGKAARF